MRYRISISCFILLCLPLLVGCNGSAGKDASVEVGGVVQAGRVRQATVSFYSVIGGQKSNKLGEGMTDGSGRYRFKIKRFSGCVLCEAEGGEYEDEATGTTRTITRTLRSVLRAIPASTDDVPLTPLTTLGAELAMASPDGITEASITEAIDNVNAWLGNGFDIATTVPVDVAIDGSSQGAGASENDYGLALGGLSRLANDLGLDPDTFLDRMVDDASDGAFDGSNEDIAVFNNPATLTTLLSGAIADFAASDKNKSGGTPSTDLVTSINGFVGNILPASPPTLSGISPGTGPADGGTAVTLTGTHFLKNVTYAVTFDGVSATSVTRMNSTTLTCTSPAGTASALVDVVVTGTNGSATLNAAFTYAASDKSKWGSMTWGSDTWSEK